MKKLIIASVMLTVFAGVAVVQPNTGQKKSVNKPDLSGTWLLDQKKSDASGLTSRPDLPITITHHDPEFRVTLNSSANGKIVAHDFIYFTDGRGETNAATSFLTTNPQAVKPEDIAKQTTQSRTRWNGNKIVTRSRLQLTVAGRMIDYELIDEWKLSADGKTLTQTTRTVFHNASSDAMFMPAMVPDKKRVYNRV